MAANLQGIWNDISGAAMGQQVHHQYQYRDELLAGGSRQPLRIHEPLFDLVKMSLEGGRRTAKEMYGARGFVFHHNIDAWGIRRRWTTPIAASGRWAAPG